MAMTNRISADSAALPGTIIQNGESAMGAPFHLERERESTPLQQKHDSSVAPMRRGTNACHEKNSPETKELSTENDPAVADARQGVAGMTTGEKSGSGADFQAPSYNCADEAHRRVLGRRHRPVAGRVHQDPRQVAALPPGLGEEPAHRSRGDAGRGLP